MIFDLISTDVIIDQLCQEPLFKRKYRKLNKKYKGSVERRELEKLFLLYSAQKKEEQRSFLEKQFLMLHNGVYYNTDGINGEMDLILKDPITKVTFERDKIIHRIKILSQIQATYETLELNFLIKEEVERKTSLRKKYDNLIKYLGQDYDQLYKKNYKFFDFDINAILDARIKVVSEMDDADKYLKKYLLINGINLKDREPFFYKRITFWEEEILKDLYNYVKIEGEGIKIRKLSYTKTKILYRIFFRILSFRDRFSLINISNPFEVEQLMTRENLTKSEFDEYIKRKISNIFKRPSKEKKVYEN